MFTGPQEAQNWLMGAGILAQLGILGLSALYLRGKIDGGQNAHEKTQNNSLADLKRQQSLIERLANEASSKATLADEKIDSHEDRCAQAYQDLKADMRDGFARIEARLNAMGRAARGAD